MACVSPWKNLECEQGQEDPFQALNMFLRHGLRRQNDSSVSFLILTAHLGNADMIQPGLIPLQPNLDFMDTFEPFQGEDLGQRKSMATCVSLYPGQSGCCFPFIEATVRMDQGEDLEFFQNFFFFFFC